VADRGYEVIAMPPPSSGGVGLLEMLNVLEGYDLKSMGFASASQIHLMAESMKRAYADRAKFLGDPDFNSDMPVERLTSKSYSADLRKTIGMDKAAKSSPASFDWPHESDETTHISVVDAGRNAVSMTYTLEQGYGVKIVVPGAGFLLNNEMGDFNDAPEMTNDKRIDRHQKPNLAEPGKRMLSSMTPTILAKDGKLFMVSGSPGGRTIINTVLETHRRRQVDFGMNAQEAVDAAALPPSVAAGRDQLRALRLLRRRSRSSSAAASALKEGGGQGVAQVIIYDTKEDMLDGGSDRRASDGGAIGVPGRTAAAGHRRPALAGAGP
jgi:gamma-glutamyltranspeptidase/glutathione hydrolase